MKRTIKQIETYKGWKIYRQTRPYTNGYGKLCTELWYYAVKDEHYFCGSKKHVIGFINSSIPANKITEHVLTALNPSSAQYEEAR